VANTGQPITGPSFLQKVEYGDAAREAAIKRVMSMIEGMYEHKFDGTDQTEPQTIANLISKITALLPHLPWSRIAHLNTSKTGGLQSRSISEQRRRK
jgi:hypothetical protein